MRQWWVSCCKSCHDGMKQRLERLGRAAIDTLARRLGRPLWDELMQGQGESKV
jgi:hypothetical protein